MSARLSLIAAIAGLAFTAPAFAADLEMPEQLPPDSTWTFTLTPYLWGASLKGDIGVLGQQPVDVDMSFGDILSNLDMTFMGAFEAHNGTWGLLADFMYVGMTEKQGITRDVGGISTHLKAKVKSDTIAATILGQYRAVAEPAGSVDLLAGIRIWHVSSDISAKLALSGTPVASYSGDDSQTWVDPMIGAKTRYSLNDKWNLVGWGAIGGFGAGSKLGWDVFGGLDYRWNDRVSMTVGYRGIGVDYRQDGFVFDVVEHGPIMGMAFSF